jgi:chemotaxis protein MotB
LLPERGVLDSIMFRRIRLSNGEGVEQWQTVYCSLMLLLLVFFVMLTTYSSIDNERMMHLQVIRKADPPATAKPPGMDQAMQSFQQMTHDSGMKDVFSIQKTEAGFKAVIPNPVLFSSGDATLNEAIYPILNVIITTARNNDLAIQVEGHTDNRPIGTASFPSNWELSTMRAVNILRYMQTKGGIPSNRLVAIGFAEYQPVAGNDSPEGREKNRRIEIIFRRAT